MSNENDTTDDQQHVGNDAAVKDEQTQTISEPVPADRAQESHSVHMNTKQENDTGATQQQQPVQQPQPQPQPQPQYPQQPYAQPTYQQPTQQPFYNQQQYAAGQQPYTGPVPPHAGQPAQSSPPANATKVPLLSKGNGKLIAITAATALVCGIIGGIGGGFVVAEISKDSSSISQYPSTGGGYGMMKGYSNSGSGNGSGSGSGSGGSSSSGSGSNGSGSSSSSSSTM